MFSDFNMLHLLAIRKGIIVVKGTYDPSAIFENLRSRPAFGQPRMSLGK